MSYWQSVPLKPLDELKPYLILHEDEFVATLPKKKGFRMSFDYETNDLSSEHGDVVGFSYSFGNSVGWYIPLRHQVGNNCDIPDALGKIYKLMSIAKCVFCYNSRFEMRWTEKYGYDAKRINFFDVMTLVFNMDTNVKNNDLKSATRHFLGYEVPTYKEIVSGVANFGFTDPAESYFYAAYDSIDTFLLAEKLGPIMMKECPFIIKMDNALLYPLMKMEDTLIDIDQDVLIQLHDEVSKRIDDLIAETWSISGTHFNIGSGKQVSDVLNSFGVDTGSKTKFGYMVTNQDVLGKLDHPLAKKIVEYRKMVKLKSSYVDVLMQAVKDKSTRFNYLHAHTPCLAEEAIVYVKKKGLVSIRDVTVGDHIWTENDFKKIVYFKKILNADVYKITLKDGNSLIGTGHHPVKNKKGEFQDLGSFSMGDEVMLGKRHIFGEELGRLRYARYFREVKIMYCNDNRDMTVVTSLKKLKEKVTVYDISVEDGGEFIANGIIVHNTARFAASGDKKNKYFGHINIQSLTCTDSLNFKAIESDSPESIFGYIFEPVWNWDKRDRSGKYIEGFDPRLNVRLAFKPPPGFIFFHLDYSMEELVIAACMSGEKKWIEAFKRGEDIHRATAEYLWGKEKYNRDKRLIVKRINFMCIFGGTEWALAKQTGYSVLASAKFLSEWRKALPQLNGWLDYIKREGRKKGVVYTAFGRPRRVLEYFTSGDRKKIGFGYRTCCNSPIQGTGGDLMRIFLPKAYDLIEKYEGKIKFVSMIHDEFNEYIHRLYMKEIILETLTAAEFKHPQWPISVRCDFELGLDWGSIFPYEIDNGCIKPKFLEI